MLRNCKLLCQIKIPKTMKNDSLFIYFLFFTLRIYKFSFIVVGLVPSIFIADQLITAKRPKRFD